MGFVTVPLDARPAPACFTYASADGSGPTAACSCQIQQVLSPVRHRRSPSVIARPTVSKQRLSLTSNGKVRYQLKRPYRDGTTHVLFEPLDFMARLTTLVPKLKVNLTRFHGVFAASSKYRARLTPAKRVKGTQPKASDEGQ